MERNYGLDLYRILCCLGVLTYHVMDDVLGIGEGIAKTLYFGASYCVPGFFLLSGFLLGSKNEVSIQYIENKIFGTVKKLFGWVIFWIIIHYIRTAELLDLWTNFTQSIVASGVEPVAWFLFTYCVLMLLGYPLHFLLKKSELIFSIVTFAWMIMLGMGVCRIVVSTRPQSLWLHLYIGYFCTGMALSWLTEKKESIEKYRKYLLCLFALIFIVFSYWYALKVRTSQDYMAPHNYYGKIYYTVWLISLFAFTYLIRSGKGKFTALIKYLSDNTFTVYLGHLPVLLFVTALYPLQSTGMAVLYICLLFIGLELTSYLFRKLPILRKIV